MVKVITPKKGGDEIDKEIKARRDQWEKDTKITFLRSEQARATDPDMAAEIAREMAEMQASN